MPIASTDASTSGGSVLIYVQHLLGTGHLKREALLAQALNAAGMRVELVSGGMPVPHLPYPVYQLPPVRCTAHDFTALIDETGQPVSDTWRTHRRDCLIDRLVRFQPDVLILETFPFGRRQMLFELMPLLQTACDARRRPLIISSVRDVLQKRRLQRTAQTVALLNEYFDTVLVHGDPAFIAFEESFPMAGEIQDKLIYTGYIAERGAIEWAPGMNGREEVIISAGGGAVGRDLMLTALAARPLSKLSALRWRFLTGPGLSARDFRAIKSYANNDVIVEMTRADFPALLSRCAVSVSQGGYNTVADLLRARARSVIVPFAGGDETEQRFRAQRLHERGYALALDEATMTPSVLAEAIDCASAMTPSTDPIDLGGAKNSAKYIVEALQSGSSC